MKSKPAHLPSYLSNSLLVPSKLDVTNRLKRDNPDHPKSQEDASPLASCNNIAAHETRITRACSRIDSDIDDLIRRFQALSLTHVRRAVGTLGVPVFLRANFLKLEFPEDLIIYDYKVIIKPNVRGEDKKTRRRIYDLFEHSEEVAPYIHNIAHDGAQRLLSKEKLPEAFTVTVTLYNEPLDGGEQYTIQVLEPKTLVMADISSYLHGCDHQYTTQNIVSAFNILISSHAARAAVRSGRHKSFFFQPGSLRSREANMPLSLNLEAWRGFSVTVMPMFKTLMVNIRTSLSAFFSPCARLSDALRTIDRTSCGAICPQTFYNTIEVTTTHFGYRRRSKIKGFGLTSARVTSIYSEERGTSTDLEQYFKDKFGICLQYPNNLPVVNIGTRDSDIYVPTEVCRVEPGQPFVGLLSKEESAAMSGHDRRFQSREAGVISKLGAHMMGFDQNIQLMAGFGVTINTQMITIPARVLPPPKVLYRSSQPLIINGSWSTKGARFMKPAQLNDTAVLVIWDGAPGSYTTDTDYAIREVVINFLGKCRSFGMKLSTALPYVHLVEVPQKDSNDPLRTNALRAIEQVLRLLTVRPKPAIVFLSSKDPHIYAGLHYICDIALGIQTLCMSIPKARAKKHQSRYFTSLALKLNTKLGGINHTIDGESLAWLKDTMLVGMDVTHPEAGCVKGTPSIAAVVATRDMHFMQYPASLRLQKYKKETITDVKAMMIERITEYKRNMKFFPKRVIVFRSGISNSQITNVMKSEVVEIKNALREFEGKPKLTFIICGRSHRTRFYPTSSHDATSICNPNAGTVVDQAVAGVYDFNFYLQAHAAKGGLARAVRYTILYDKNFFSADDLQQGINDLSYIWTPASQSSSVVPPVYWADLACERARLYLHPIMPPIAGSKDSTLDEKQIEDRARELWHGGAHADLKDSMFYL